MNYKLMSPSQREAEYALLRETFQKIQSQKLSMDMSRGKPEPRQLDFGEELLTALSHNEDCKTEEGFDVRNYGLPHGIPEVKRLFAQLTEAKESEVFIGGNSSLKLMYNVLADACLVGFEQSPKPWAKCDTVKFLCPAPGYDRHFSLCEHLNIEMIPIPMLDDGPDMDLIEDLVSMDESIKGIWCVPKYSNPTGITFSDKTVRRFAALKPKAPDFKIFWDNAYMIHDLYEEGDKLLNLLHEAKKYGNEDRIYEFGSTSKVTYAGSGIAFLATSEKNVLWLQRNFDLEGLGYDKINQLRHFRYLKSVENIRAIMKRHAAVLRPKFEDVLATFERSFGDSGVAEWSKPRGGYFISLNVLPGTAARTFELAVQLGVTLTGVGSTFPYRKDPADSNLRIAPTNVSPENVSFIAECIAICAKMASLEKLMGICT